VQVTRKPAVWSGTLTSLNAQKQVVIVGIHDFDRTGMYRIDIEWDVIRFPLGSLPIALD
jgi:hypothetical protein